MTDARLKPTFLGDPKVDDLSDAAYRVYVNGLVHCARNETDGFVARRAVKLLHPDSLDLSQQVSELVRAGLWEPSAEGWEVHAFLRHQSSKEQLDALREKARNKKARQRRTQRQQTPSSWPKVARPGGTGVEVPEGTTVDVPEGTTGDVPQGTHRSVPEVVKGQDRSGQAEEEELSLCVVCHQRMTWVEPGETTHPACDPRGNVNSAVVSITERLRGSA